MSAVPPPACVLCTTAGGTPVWQGARLRVIRADEPGFPGFYRVVWQDHVAEFSDLALADRLHCMEAVALVERVVIERLAPAKVNLAALGNMVPHLHWHIVARYIEDSRFPAPLWAPEQRPRDAAHEAAVAARLPDTDAEIARRCQATFGAT